jgi:hypothetical protein
MRTIGSIVVLAMLATPLRAQLRRQAEPGGPPAGPSRDAAPLVVPDVAADASRPFVGAWRGDFHGSFGDDAPMAVVIEFVNGGYASYSALGPGAPLHPNAATTVAGDSVVWSHPNNGGGTLVFTARLRGGALAGVMTLHDGPPELMKLQPTFTLRRVTPADGHARR